LSRRIQISLVADEGHGEDVSTMSSTRRPNNRRREHKEQLAQQAKTSQDKRRPNNRRRQHKEQLAQQAHAGEQAQAGARAPQAQDASTDNKRGALQRQQKKKI
jgi:hypothetical protein